MRASWRVMAIVLIGAIASACAVIPSSGPVRKVADEDGLGQSAVRYAPARPLAGASPEQIVRGYLDAMLAFPSTSRTASAFLTPAAATEWRASSQVSIYSSPAVAPAEVRPDRGDVRGQPGGGVTVDLAFTEDAQLDRLGRYSRRAAPRTVTYSLEQVDGQWRIANPQDGLLVNTKFFTDYFRQFDLFYFDRPGRRLVPEPTYLVVGDQLATTLVASLASGSPTGADEAVRTYVPARGALRPSVPVSSEGVADVEFTQDFGDLSQSARDHLSAQIVWTLRQVPGIEGVQVVGGSTSLTAGGDEVQPVQAWGGYGPSTARGSAFAIVDDTVVGIDDGEIEPVPGAWGRSARGARSIAVSEDGIAGVLSGGNRVRVTDREGGSARTITGNGFLEPDWDSDGAVWLVDRADGRTRAQIVEGSVARVIDVGEVADLQVGALKISPDGSRYAVTGRGENAGQLYVGRVLRDVKDRVLGLGTPRRVFTTAQLPRSASWSSGTDLSFLGDSEAGVQVYQASIDGSETTSEVSRSGALLPDVGAKALAIGVGSLPVLYATDRDDQLWFLAPEGTWRLLDIPQVTGLTFGR